MEKLKINKYKGLRFIASAIGTIAVALYLLGIIIGVYMLIRHKEYNVYLGMIPASSYEDYAGFGLAAASFINGLLFHALGNGLDAFADIAENSNSLVEILKRDIAEDK